MNVIIREAASADRPAMLALWVEAWTAFLPEIDFKARLSWFRGYLDDLECAGATILVAAAAAEDVLGFVTVDAARQNMDQLVTAVGAQRQGIGRRLVRAAKARSPEGLSLTVVQCNGPALALYRSEGFEVVREDVSLRSGLPMFVMRWSGCADEFRVSA